MRGNYKRFELYKASICERNVGYNLSLNLQLNFSLQINFHIRLFQSKGLLELKEQRSGDFRIKSAILVD